MSATQQAVSVALTAVGVALPRLKVEEGFKGALYRDTNGLETIGYGFCVSRGVTRRVAAATLSEQIAEAHDALLVYAWYAGLDPVRQAVCLDIAVNEGLGGLLHFPSMIHYLGIKDWASAAAQCAVQDQKLAGRYAALAEMLKTGIAA